MTPRKRLMMLGLWVGLATPFALAERAAAHSSRESAGAVASVLKPAMPKLHTLLIPAFLPQYLPSDVRNSMTTDQAVLQVTTGPQKRSYAVSVDYSVASGGLGNAGTSGFRIYVFKTTGRVGGLGSLAARVRKVKIVPNMTTYLDSTYGGTKTTNQLGAAVYWTYRGNTYSIAVNHNDSLAQLYRVVRSLISVNAR
jgi:hypothetical protein